MRGGLPQRLKLSAQNLMIFVVGLLLGALFSSWSSQAATIHPDIAVSGVQFATEQEIETRFDLEFSIRSKKAMTRAADRRSEIPTTRAADRRSEIPTTRAADRRSEIPMNEAKLLGFFESGYRGQSSIDLDPVVLRLDPIAEGHLWIGRTHPAGEAFGLKRIERTSAIGANWVQNQQNALDPRVSGWIGAGFRQGIRSTRLSVTMGYSPIFLPSFSPSLELSPSEEARGSRFTKLPPAEVRFANGTQLPIRYDLQTGNLMDIVRQDQWFHSVGYSDSWIEASAFGWSGPRPDPMISHSEKLRILRESSVDVLVTARPSFPRQHFWGTRLASPGIPLAPELELAWEAHSRQTTASFALQPLKSWRLGTVNRFGDRDRSYARTLIWTEASSPLYMALSGGLRYEQHMLHDYEGAWVKPTLQYQATSTFTLFATANVIAGQDGSYFGHWRSLDSFAMGANARW